jgi:hypothetical protein
MNDATLKPIVTIGFAMSSPVKACNFCLSRF